MNLKLSITNIEFHDYPQGAIRVQLLTNNIDDMHLTIYDEQEDECVDFRQPLSYLQKYTLLVRSVLLDSQLANYDVTLSDWTADDEEFDADNSELKLQPVPFYDHFTLAGCQNADDTTNHQPVGVAIRHATELHVRVNTAELAGYDNVKECAKNKLRDYLEMTVSMSAAV